MPFLFFVKRGCFTGTFTTDAARLHSSHAESAARERDSLYIQFAVQRPGDLIHVPHLTTHSVLTYDMGTTTISAGWDCCNISNEKLNVQLIDNFLPGVTKERWSAQFRLGGFDSFEKWCFKMDSDSEMYQHSEYLKKWCPNLVKNISLSDRKNRKRKYNFDQK